MSTLVLKDTDGNSLNLSSGSSRLALNGGLRGPIGPRGPLGMQGIAGEQGVPGPEGNTGPAGVGIAAGGAPSEILAKQSESNYDTTWVTLTKDHVGLTDVDNTPDTAKPVSTPQQAALDQKTDLDDNRLTNERTPVDESVTNAKIAPGASIAISKLELDPTLRTNHAGTQSADTLIDGSTNKVFLADDKTKLAGIQPGATVNQADSYLLARGNQTGTQAASTISDFTTAADARITVQKGVNGGLATLDPVTGKLPSAQLPAGIDEILEYANFAALPGTGVAAKIYITIDDNKQFRWSGSTYVEIVSNPGSTDAVVEGASNLYFTTGRAAAAAPVQSVAGQTGAVTLTKTNVGLANVDNTTDMNKPVSTATATAIAAAEDQLMGAIMALG